MATAPARAHVIAGGFPPGQNAGHDHDYARLRLLELLRDQQAGASCGNDFNDVQRWLPTSRLLITYVAGPYPNAEQTRAIGEWVEDGGHWLGLHGTAGGRALRDPEAGGRRRMMKLDHHALVGGYFLSHPPIKKFEVTVADAPDKLIDGLPPTFDVIDEPYMIEVQDPENTRVLLTSALGPDWSPPGFGMVYDEDTSLMPDGKTRALAFTRAIGRGSVTYVALGHCHSPGSNVQPFVDTNVDPDGKTPLSLHNTWEQPAYERLLRNVIDVAMGG